MKNNRAFRLADYKTRLIFVMWLSLIHEMKLFYEPNKHKTIMPVIYKGMQSSIATKAGKKLFYPSVVLTGNVNTRRIAEEIAELSSLSPGDSMNVINNLVTVMTRHLQASESVTLDGFGTFRFSMKSAGKGVESMDKVSATQSNLMVRFLPSSTRNLDRSIATRSLVTGVKCVRFDLQQAEGEKPSVPGDEEGPLK